MKYAEAEHVERLLILLGKNDPCSNCPYPPFEDSVLAHQDECVLCRQFLGIANTSRCPCYPCCPCCILGKQECIKQTWLALEAGGYLDEEETI